MARICGGTLYYEWGKEENELNGMENYCYSTHRQKIPHKLHTGWRNHPREELTKSAPESDPLVKAAAAQRFHCCFLLLYRDVNRRHSGQAGGRNALVKACNTKPSPRENAICSGRTISHLWNLGSILTKLGDVREEKNRTWIQDWELKKDC